MLDRLANEIVIAGKLMGTNNVSRIAADLGYQPMLLINALFAGEEAGKFVWVRKKDILKVSSDLEIFDLAITEGIAESREQIEIFITNQNSIEKDIVFEEIQGFLPMLPEMHVRIALKTSKLLDSYELTDPADKESTYTFWSLKENVDKRWGTKQFDPKKSKVARKAARKEAKQ